MFTGDTGRPKHPKIQVMAESGILKVPKETEEQNTNARVSIPMVLFEEDT